jgi:hypothetical protein
MTKYVVDGLLRDAITCVKMALYGDVASCANATHFIEQARAILAGPGAMPPDTPPVVKDGLADLPLNEKGEPYDWSHAMAVLAKQRSEIERLRAHMMGALKWLLSRDPLNCRHAKDILLIGLGETEEVFAEKWKDHIIQPPAAESDRCLNTNSDGLRCTLTRGSHIAHSNGETAWVTRAGKFTPRSSAEPEVNAAERGGGATTEAHERLKDFLYILMRDELPTGKIEAVMQHLRPVEHKLYGGNMPTSFPVVIKGRRARIFFSAPHLEAYAAEFASEILGKPDATVAGEDYAG